MCYLKGRRLLIGGIGKIKDKTDFVRRTEATRNEETVPKTWNIHKLVRRDLCKFDRFKEKFNTPSV